MDLRLLKEDRRHGTPQFPFAAYVMECPAGTTVLDNHWHDEVEFLWVVEGQATFQIGLTNYELKSGEAMFVPGGEVHGGFSSDRSSCSYRAAVFQLDWLGGSRDSLSSPYLEQLSKREAEIPLYYDGSTKWGRGVLERLDQLFRIYESSAAARELRIKAELILLMSDLIDSGQWLRANNDRKLSSHTVDLLKAAVTYMETNFSQPLTVPELAKVAGMSVGHFSRMFKTLMRKTPMDFLNQYRIKQAAQLLQNTDWSIAEVAMETGLTNFSYFSKKFSTVHACTPSQFRKKFRSL